MNNDYEFRCSIIRKHVDKRLLLTFIGTCDKQTAAINKAIIKGYVEMGENVILVDIAELSFESYEAFQALGECCADVSRIGGRLIIINPQPAVREGMKGMPLDGGCVVADSLDEALLKAKEK